jgi:predicted lipoprotein with Yx(FWY)xxD motif
MSIATIVRSRMTKVGLPLVTAGVLAAACSSGMGTTATAAPAAQGSASSSATVTVTDGHLTDGAGRTMYLWVVDPTGKSTCYSACASVWPPVPATGTPTVGPGVDASKISTIKRTDGSSQLAYAGHALYYFAPDKSAGQTTGQGNNGFGAKWWEVNPAGQAITTAGGSSSTAPSTAPSSSVPSSRVPSPSGTGY